MTRKKPKISYRDLLAPRHDAATVPLAPAVPAMPPPESVDRSTEPPSALDLAVVLNPGLAHKLTPVSGVHLVLPDAVVQMVRALTPVQQLSTVQPAPYAQAATAVPRATTTVALRRTAATHAVVGTALRAALAEHGSAELLLFRVGRERFAVRLCDVEEALESPVIHPIPERAREMLGVCALRGRLVPVYAPSRVLGVTLDAHAVALVFPFGDKRIAIAVDDVDDVFTMKTAALRDAPGTDDTDGVLVGVTRRDGRLVSVLDATALVTACLNDFAMETT